MEAPLKNFLRFPLGDGHITLAAICPECSSKLSLKLNVSH